MISHLVRVAASLVLSLPLLSCAADAQRQSDVAKRGAEVMPFRLDATKHVFTRTADGGVQRVVARQSNDMEQVKLVRAHLRQIEWEFRNGDFRGPEHIHGAAMPGLADLRAAAPGRISISYRDIPAGAELRYRTGDPDLVHALHAWFDAQLSDHGADAMQGHAQHLRDQRH